MLLALASASSLFSNFDEHHFKKCNFSLTKSIQRRAPLMLAALPPQTSIGKFEAATIAFHSLEVAAGLVVCHRLDHLSPESILSQCQQPGVEELRAALQDVAAEKLVDSCIYFGIAYRWGMRASSSGLKFLPKRELALARHFGLWLLEFVKQINMYSSEFYWDSNTWLGAAQTSLLEILNRAPVDNPHALKFRKQIETTTELLPKSLENLFDQKDNIQKTDEYWDQNLLNQWLTGDDEAHMAERALFFLENYPRAIARSSLDNISQLFEPLLLKPLSYQLPETIVCKTFREMSGLLSLNHC